MTPMLPRLFVISLVKQQAPKYLRVTQHMQEDSVHVHRSVRVSMSTTVIMSVVLTVIVFIIIAVRMTLFGGRDSIFDVLVPMRAIRFKNRRRPIDSSGSASSRAIGVGRRSRLV